MNGGIQLLPARVQFFDLRSQFPMDIGCWMSTKNLRISVVDLLQLFPIVLQCTFEILGRRIERGID